MGILQEYRFYLIIAVIALAAIIFLFFRTQTSQGYVDFTTELKSNFAQIKGQASDVKSLTDVVTLGKNEFRGMDNNQLFGMTLSGANLDVTGTETLLTADADALVSADLETPAEGEFKVVFEDPTVTGNITASGATVATTPAGKGWNLDANGSIIYVFKDEKVAKKVMVDYIPEGTLVSVAEATDKNGVKVPFIQR